MGLGSLIRLIVMASSAYHVYGYVQFHRPSSINNEKRASSLSQLFVTRALGGKHPDNDPTKAIKQAIEVTKTYGATSYKARMAWEVVEKIEYTNNNRRSKQKKKKAEIMDLSTGSDGTPTNKLDMSQIHVMDDSTFDTVENNVRDLKSLLDEEMVKIKNLKTMADEIKVRTCIVELLIIYMHQYFDAFW